MTTNNPYCQWALSAAAFLFAAVAQAEGRSPSITHIPSITIAPLTAGGNIIVIAPGHIVNVDYKITNNIMGQGPQWTWNNTTNYLSRAHSGGSGGLPDCGGTTFTQAQGSSCIFRLQINGTAFAASNHQVPASTPNFISGMVNYGPSENNQLSVTSNSTTLTVSVQTLALSVKNTELNAALTGNTRFVTITNTGPIPATGLSIADPVPALPTDSTWSSPTCGTTLEPSASCAIRINPGATSTTKCASGQAPTPSVFSISANNAPTVTTNVDVLSYGCLYQGGLIYSVADEVPYSNSIGGKVVTTSNVSNSTNWDTAKTNCTDATINQYNGWYLPLICELGYGEAGCPETHQNIRSNIVNNGVQTILGDYWSATEGDILGTSWVQQYIPPSQFQQLKPVLFNVRCARDLTR